MRNSKPVSVTLGGLENHVRRRVASGEYSSVSEVVREGIRALDRQDELFEAVLKARVEEALANPGPEISAADVSASLRARHAARLKRDL